MSKLCNWCKVPIVNKRKGSIYCKNCADNLKKISNHYTHKLKYFEKNRNKYKKKYQENKIFQKRYYNLIEKLIVVDNTLKIERGLKEWKKMQAQTNQQSRLKKV